MGAFQDSTTGDFTLSNIKTAASGIYLHGFGTTLGVAVITSIVPGIVGFLVAYAIFTAKRGAVLRRCVITASGVFANFGGVPLAFLFIATLGSTGMVTQWLTDIGLNPYTNGFNLYTFSGIVVVYMYFQIPLMVLVILPALEGSAPPGGRRRTTWARAPGSTGVMWAAPCCCRPPWAACCCCSAALLRLRHGRGADQRSVPLTAIQIGSFLNGNVLAGQQNVGKALGLGMIVIIAIVMTAYAVLQRRSAQWLR